MRAAIAALLLAGCAAAAPPAPPSPAPVAMPVLACPGPVAVPPAPKVPRTVEAIARWSVRMDEALVRSERARADCAASLATLKSLILSGAPQ